MLGISGKKKGKLRIKIKGNSGEQHAGLVDCGLLRQSRHHQKKESSSSRVQALLREKSFRRSSCLEQEATCQAPFPRRGSSRLYENPAVAIFDHAYSVCSSPNCCYLLPLLKSVLARGIV